MKSISLRLALTAGFIAGGISLLSSLVTPAWAAETAPAALPSLGQAPAWKLKDLDGKDVSSDQLKGKTVVVDFWATWCAPCVGEIPSYVALQKKYGKDGLVIVGVSEDQIDVSRVKEFVQKHDMNYLVVMDHFDVAAAFGGTEALPTTVLIDRNGEMRDRKVGAQDAADYEKKVQSLLK